MLKLLLLLLQRNLQRAVCGCEQQWSVICLLRLRGVDIVVEQLLRLVEQVVVKLLLVGRRSVVVVEVVEALVRVRAWVGRIGDDGLHHVGQWVLAVYSLAYKQPAGDLDEARSRRVDGSMDR